MEKDAKVCCKYSDNDSMVIFHDLAYPEVANGFAYFVKECSNQWKTKIYQTQQIIGIAWKGNITPPEHIPDPKFNWTIPKHLVHIIRE
jgi:hypothetical protein